MALMISMKVGRMLDIDKLRKVTKPVCPKKSHLFVVVMLYSCLLLASPFSSKLVIIRATNLCCGGGGRGVGGLRFPAEKLIELFL